jgi:hypothetical protein
MHPHVVGFSRVSFHRLAGRGFPPIPLSALTYVTVFWLCSKSGRYSVV